MTRFSPSCGCAETPGLVFALAFADNDAMKTLLVKTSLTTALALIPLLGTLAAAGAQTPLGYTLAPGYDRPASYPAHQHVVYWNDSFDHYDMTMQTAADAYLVGDLREKKREKPEAQYPHKTPKHR